jgi:hypothetical protein
MRRNLQARLILLRPGKIDLVVRQFFAFSHSQGQKPTFAAQKVVSALHPDSGHWRVDLLIGPVVERILEIFGGGCIGGCSGGVHVHLSPLLVEHSAFWNFLCAASDSSLMLSGSYLAVGLVKVARFGIEPTCVTVFDFCLLACATASVDRAAATNVVPIRSVRLDIDISVSPSCEAAGSPCPD